KGGANGASLNSTRGSGKATLSINGNAGKSVRTGSNGSVGQRNGTSSGDGTPGETNTSPNIVYEWSSGSCGDNSVRRNSNHGSLTHASVSTSNDSRWTHGRHPGSPRRNLQGVSCSIIGNTTLKRGLSR